MARGRGSVLDSLGALQAAQPPEARYFYLTTKFDRPYYAERFRPDDFLVFGRETKGLPETLLQANRGRLLTIPMHGTRSLNLATAVAIVLFEAVRQQSCTTMGTIGRIGYSNNRSSAPV